MSNRKKKPNLSGTVEMIGYDDRLGNQIVRAAMEQQEFLKDDDFKREILEWMDRLEDTPATEEPQTEPQVGSSETSQSGSSVQTQNKQ